MLAATGISPLATKLRTRPTYYPDKLPAILGCNGAGIANAMGTWRDTFTVGDTDYFCSGGIGDELGCYAEYINLHEGCCAFKQIILSLHQSSSAAPGNDRR